LESWGHLREIGRYYIGLAIEPSHFSILHTISALGFLSSRSWCANEFLKTVFFVNYMFSYIKIQWHGNCSDMAHMDFRVTEYRRRWGIEKDETGNAITALPRA
jgi:hypothetical protein